jgi:hypothetical protein
MSDPIPELRLWQAVLWRATQDLQASESSRDREFQDVLLAKQYSSKHQQVYESVF